VRFEESSVHGEVGGTTRVGLHVHAPLLGIETVGLEGARLTEFLNLIDDFISSVVSGVGETLRIFIGEGRSKAFHDSTGCEVLGSDELKRLPLAILLLLNEVEHDGIMLLKGLQPGEFLK